MLYHRDIGFPSNLQRPTGRLRLRYGGHAREAAQTDRYGIIRLPECIDLDRAELIEAEANWGGIVSKAVVRVGYSAVYDLVLVVLPDGFVKTVWLNERHDVHATLKYGRYARP